MWSCRCDTAEVCDMRLWRVGIARNAMFFFIVLWLRCLRKSAPKKGSCGGESRKRRDKSSRRIQTMCLLRLFLRRLVPKIMAIILRALCLYTLDWNIHHGTHKKNGRHRQQDTTPLEDKGPPASNRWGEEPPGQRPLSSLDNPSPAPRPPPRPPTWELHYFQWFRTHSLSLSLFFVFLFSLFFLFFLSSLLVRLTNLQCIVPSVGSLTSKLISNDFPKVVSFDGTTPSIIALSNPSQLNVQTKSNRTGRSPRPPWSGRPGSRPPPP